MIGRALQSTAQTSLQGFPVLALTGPRQSGKTTLARSLAAERPYASLEDPDIREFATSDPRGFLKQFPEGAVLDEVQRCPDLFSYLQSVVDAAPDQMGRFILTGSQQFGLIEAITQSLAGRVALLELLPFSLSELQSVGRAPLSLPTLLTQGLFPPIYDRPVTPSAWLRNYVATYVERDIRQVLRIQDTAAFQRFVALCAGRVGQLLNVSSLANDAGISRITAESWLSVMQASYLIFLIRPHFANLSKRIIKSPKLYFHDPGLAAWLLGIREPSHVSTHPLRGALFENWVMCEIAKAQAAQGEAISLNYWRDKEGHEIDAVVERMGALHAIEVKSGQTVASDFFENLDFWRQQQPNTPITPWLVYGGSEPQNRERGTVVPWSQISKLTDSL